MNGFNQKPPKAVNWLLRRFCDDLLIEDLLGDMEEEFHRNVAKYSILKAKRKYFSEALSLIFSSSIYRRKQSISIHPFAKYSNLIAMFKNYFIIAVRSLARNRFFTLINILGLAFGMSVTILYIGFVSSLLKFDQFHEHYDNIYRIVSKVDHKTRVLVEASSPLVSLVVLRQLFSASG